MDIINTENELFKVKCILDQLIKNAKKDECTIATGGSPDESMILGSKEAILNLCQFLINSLYSIESKKNIVSLDTDVINGVEYLYTNDIKYYFNELGEVWPIALGICKTHEQTLEIAKSIKLI